MSKKIRQLKAIALAASLVASAMPGQMLFAAETNDNLIYQNDFEADENAIVIGDNKAIEFAVEGDKANSWLTIFQHQLQFEYDEAISAGTILSFDIILPEDASYVGTLKAQAVTQMGNDWAWTQSETIPEIVSTDFTSLGNGYKSYSVAISFGAEVEAVQGIKAVVPCLASSNCDYTGKIYLDNVKLIKPKAKATEANIVKATESALEQKGIEVGKENIVVNGKKVNTNSEVKLADEKAVNSVAQLYAYLEAVGKTDSVLYGHQNDIHHKAGSKALSNSDTKDVTGSIAAIVGIDTLSLVGNEFPGGLQDQYSKGLSNAELVTECAKITKEAVSEGAIITLSAHMPNFSIMADRSENKKGADGTLDWKKANFLSEGNNTDGSWVTGGDVVSNCCLCKRSRQ